MPIPLRAMVKNTSNRSNRNETEETIAMLEKNGKGHANRNKSNQK